MKTFSLTLLLSLLTAVLAVAQPAHAGSVAAVTAAVSPASIARGGKGVMTIEFTIAPGYHVNANKPNDPDLIPAEFVPDAVKGVTFGAPQYPAARSIADASSAKPLLVYMGTSQIVVPFTVAKSAAPGTLALTGSFSFQACNATACNPPESASTSVSVIVK